MRRVVVALGGNALLQKGDAETADAMRRSARSAAEIVADIAAAGWEVVVTHGNGPQVGRILLQNEAASQLVAPMPLDICGAESQGQIGYLLQDAIGDVFYERNMERPVATVLTLTRVRAADPAFQNPTKPIGPYYTAEEAARLTEDRGYTMAPSPGADGTWRRVVPSPRPYSIVEAPVVERLVADGVIVIASGGGGVPVVEQGDRLVGVEAVIDKDLAACILAVDVAADALLILTDIDAVYRGFGTPQQEPIPALPAAEAAEMLAAGSLGAGSMGPKVDAAMTFASSRQGRFAVIAALADGARALAGEAGTRVAG